MGDSEFEPQPYIKCNIPTNGYIFFINMDFDNMLY
jgi:hypothetical protein